MTKYILSLFAMLMMVTVLGCGDGGGSVGDENDPAATTDEEQMEDETGDVE